MLFDVPKVSKKSVIKYPGSKRRIARNIAERILIKNGSNQVVSPFLGGGSVEILLSSKGVKVLAYDKFLPLVEFFQVLLSEPKLLQNTVENILEDNDYISDPNEFVYPISDKSETMFRTASKRSMEASTQLERSAWFYIKNKSSYGGLMYVRTGTTHDRCISIDKNNPLITPKRLETLGNFYSPHLKVEYGDYREICLKHSDNFFYLDPPYYDEKYDRKGEGLYGIDGMLHTGFDHHELREMVNNITGFVMSYNNSEYIKQLYNPFRIDEVDLTYNLGKLKGKSLDEFTEPKEIIISSY